MSLFTKQGKNQLMQLAECSLTPVLYMYKSMSFSCENGEKRREQERETVRTGGRTDIGRQQVVQILGGNVGKVS